MTAMEDPIQILGKLENALKSPAIADKLKALRSIPVTETGVKAEVLTAEEFGALGLPRQFVFGRLVRLPRNMKPPLETHNEAIQITAIADGRLMWVQGNGTDPAKSLMVPNTSMHTPAGVFHGHATGNEYAIVLAVFTRNDPAKDSLKDYDWTRVKI